jgi:hypothetical protein
MLEGLPVLPTFHLQSLHYSSEEEMCLAGYVLAHHWRTMKAETLSPEMVCSNSASTLYEHQHHHHQHHYPQHISTQSDITILCSHTPATSASLFDVDAPPTRSAIPVSVYECGEHAKISLAPYVQHRLLVLQLHSPTSEAGAALDHPRTSGSSPGSCWHAAAQGAHHKFTIP